MSIGLLLCMTYELATHLFDECDEIIGCKLKCSTLPIIGNASALYILVSGDDGTV